MTAFRAFLALAFGAAVAFGPAVGFSAAPPAAPVAVRFREGVVHGFLELGTTDGKILADGDSIQYVHGDVVTNRLVFRFRDGSLQDETVTFREGRSFELLTDHLVQKGPSFPHPVELRIDRPGGTIRVTAPGKDGCEAVTETRMPLPADLANGIIVARLKNLRRDTGPSTMTILAAAPKPALVRLIVTREGKDRISVGRLAFEATRYVVHVDVGGIKQVLAKLLGKLPPDTRVWVLEGDAPTFLRSEGPAFLGGPSWRIQLTSPTWPARP